MTVAKVVAKVMDEYEKAKAMPSIGKPFTYALQSAAKWSNTYETDRNKVPPKWARCKDCIHLSTKRIPCKGNKCINPDKKYKSDIASYKMLSQKPCKHFEMNEAGKELL